MRSFVHIILQLSLSVTGCDAVLKASDEAIHIKPLVKQLTERRKMALSIVSPNVQNKRTTFAYFYNRGALSPLSVRRITLCLKPLII